MRPSDVYHGEIPHMNVTILHFTHSLHPPFSFSLEQHPQQRSTPPCQTFHAFHLLFTVYLFSVIAFLTLPVLKISSLDKTSAFYASSAPTQETKSLVQSVEFSAERVFRSVLAVACAALAEARSCAIVASRALSYSGMNGSSGF